MIEEKGKMETGDIHPAVEMNYPLDEVRETLPIEEPETEVPEEDYFEDYEGQEDEAGKQNAPLMFDQGFREDNIVKWQLQVDWTRIEQIIRGYRPKTDSKGNEYFEKIENHYLNENGVNEVLNTLSFYLSKEIFLAAYDVKEVNIRIKQFSKKFNDFVWDNLEELGMDTPEKKKKAPMLVLNIANLVDAAYSRSIGGEERKSLRQTTHITQSGQLLNPNSNLQGQMAPQKKNVFSRMLS